MKIAFDLHNLRDGGGPNYIRNLLLAADPAVDGFDELHLVGAPQLLDALPDRAFIVRHRLPALAAPLPRRVAHVATRLPPLLREQGIDLLYAPGGIAFGNFRPYATISRNMMPFTPEAWRHYPPLGADRLRLALLRRLNAASFARADAMIFLTGTARDTIMPLLGKGPARVATIPHGVDRARFAAPARAIVPGLGRTRPAKILYPSRLEPYKHQLEVIEAVAALLADLPLLELDLCGPANPAYRRRVELAIAALPPCARSRVRYAGTLATPALAEAFAAADLMLFASSCENLPNTLIEALASGVPLVSSNLAPMPEVAGDAALYFDPRQPAQIAAAIRAALADPAAAAARARVGVERAAAYDWGKCARATFALLTQTARDYRRQGN